MRKKHESKGCKSMETQISNQKYAKKLFRRNRKLMEQMMQKVNSKHYLWETGDNISDWKWANTDLWDIQLSPVQQRRSTSWLTSGAKILPAHKEEPYTHWRLHPHPPTQTLTLLNCLLRDVHLGTFKSVGVESTGDDTAEAERGKQTVFFLKLLWNLTYPDHALAKPPCQISKTQEHPGERQLLFLFQGGFFLKVDLLSGISISLTSVRNNVTCTAEGMMDYHLNNLHSSLTTFFLKHS